MTSIDDDVHRSEVRSGMRIEWDLPIPMRDGTILRADVFLPLEDGQYPVIVTHGPYAKGLTFQVGFAGMWNRLVEAHPDVPRGSTNEFQVWETVDPEKWVPDGYACVRIDSRGSGRSPGVLEVWSPQEAEDYYDAIEWLAVQPWCSGKVGLLGISYYAANQWQVAALKPPHLTAICPWEGYVDFYRGFTRHGGIMMRFGEIWLHNQVFSVQHGLGERGGRSRMTGELITGPETLSEDELACNRVETFQEVARRPFDDDFYRAHGADPSLIDVPLLSAGNWSHHLHTRGNFEGYDRASSPQKWLEIHGNEHFAEFYTDYGIGLQKQFFGHFLQGADNGWTDRAPVTLQIRHTDGTFVERAEQEWPLERTEWTRLNLDPSTSTLTSAVPADGGIEIDATDPAGATFWSEPLEQTTELTGPMSASLLVSSSTSDADVFVTFRIQDETGHDVWFVTATEERGIATFGALRASHRELDEEQSTPYRPVHPHQRAMPLTPGEPVRLEIEILPSSMVMPAGYRFGFTVSGCDYEIPGDGPWPSIYGMVMKGQGLFMHDDPSDRPADIFGGRITIHAGADGSSVLIPVIP
jgi:predicted acyl esterase